MERKYGADDIIDPIREDQRFWICWTHGEEGHQQNNLQEENITNKYKNLNNSI